MGVDRERPEPTGATAKARGGFTAMAEAAVGAAVAPEAPDDGEGVALASFAAAPRSGEDEEPAVPRGGEPSRRLGQRAPAAGAEGGIRGAGLVQPRERARPRQLTSRRRGGEGGGSRGLEPQVGDRTETWLDRDAALPEGPVEAALGIETGEEREGPFVVRADRAIDEPLGIAAGEEDATASVNAETAEVDVDVIRPGGRGAGFVARQWEAEGGPQYSTFGEPGIEPAVREVADDRRDLPGLTGIGFVVVRRGGDQDASLPVDRDPGDGEVGRPRSNGEDDRAALPKAGTGGSVGEKRVERRPLVDVDPAVG